MDTFIANKAATALSNLEAYLKDHDKSFLAEDAVFKNMSTNEDIVGRDAIADMLHYMYHIAFDAKAVIKNTAATENTALLEAMFVGKHIGEFAGLEPTGKNVNVPLCVTYDLNDEGLIQKARIYMLTDVLVMQLTSD